MLSDFSISRLFFFTKASRVLSKDLDSSCKQWWADGPVVVGRATANHCRQKS